MKDYLAARQEAGSARGIEYAHRLETMPPLEAADELYDMFCLCADEDLAIQIAEDLEISREASRRISAEILKIRSEHFPA